MASACYRCGAGLGLFASGEPICARCKAWRDGALRTWVGALEQATADGVFTAEEEAALRQYQGQLGLWDQEVAAYIPQIHRAKALTQAIRGILTPVSSPVILQVGEQAYFCVPATLLEERTYRQYQSGSRGVSVRLMKGVTFRTGSTRGLSVPVSEMVPVAHGTFTITSKRTVFSGHKMVAVPHKKLVSFEAFSDGMRLDFEGRKKPQYFQFADGEFAAAVLTAASSDRGIRPGVGQTAYLYDEDDPGSTVSIYPNDATIRAIADAADAGHDEWAEQTIASMPTVEPGTVVVVGNPGELAVSVQIRSGPMAGIWGYVLATYLNASPLARY